MSRAEPGLPMAAPRFADDVEYYERLKRLVAGRGLPLAMVDLDRLEANAQAMRLRVGNLPIRVCTKSIRCVDVLRRVQALSPQFAGLLCYSAREAHWLATQGFDDLLVAYPTVDPIELAAAAQALRGNARLTLMVDSIEQCDLMEAKARQFGVRFRLAIDLDMSSDVRGVWFGVRRSPIRSVTTALAVAERISRAPGALQLVGLMGYEGQIAGLQDHVPGTAMLNWMVRKLKPRSIAEIHARRHAVVTALRRAGHTLAFINGGGTGSLEATAADASVTEAAAGSGFYSPALFDHFGHFRHLPAAFFALPVVRRPAPGMVTCSGGGYIASGPAGPDRLPKPFLPQGMQLIPNEGTGEVQTPVLLPKGCDPDLGDPLFFRHAKAGELAERFSTLLLFRGDKVVAEAPTYRGMGQCFF